MNTYEPYPTTINPASLYFTDDKVSDLVTVEGFESKDGTIRELTHALLNGGEKKTCHIVNKQSEKLKKIIKINIKILKKQIPKDSPSIKVLHDLLSVVEEVCIKKLIEKHGLDKLEILMLEGKVKSPKKLKTIFFIVKKHFKYKESEESISKFLKKIMPNSDINHTDFKGLSLLKHAILSKNNKIVKKLIKLGADVNANELLHFAVEKNNLDAIKILLQNGVRVEALNSEGYTSKMLAMGVGKQKILDELSHFDRDFTNFWIQYKMLAHRFGFDFKIELFNKKFELEGFYDNITYLQMLESFKQFAQNDSVNCDDLQKIIDILEQSKNLNNIFSLDPDKIYTFPIGVGKNAGDIDHSVNITISGNILIKGERSTADQGIRNRIHGLRIYEIGNREELKQALFRLIKCKDDSPYYFFEKGLNEVLMLKEIHTMELSRQPSNNCSWCSAKLGLQSSAYLHFRKKGLSHEEAERSMKNIYKTWSGFDRVQSVKNFLQTLNTLHESSITWAMQQELKKSIPQVLSKILIKTFQQTARDSESSHIHEYKEIQNLILKYDPGLSKMLF